MDDIKNKLDKIQDDITEIKVTMAVNTANLGEHMARTEQVETAIEILKKELTPVRDHVLKVNYTIALIGAIGSVAAFAYSITHVISFFHH